MFSAKKFFIPSLTFTEPLILGISVYCDVSVLVVLFIPDSWAHEFPVGKATMKAADNNIPTPIIAGISTFFCTSFFENDSVFM